MGQYINHAERSTTQQQKGGVLEPLSKRYIHIKEITSIHLSLQKKSNRPSHYSPGIYKDMIGSVPDHEKQN